MCVKTTPSLILCCYFCWWISQTIKLVKWYRTWCYVTPNSEQVNHKRVKQVCKQVTNQLNTHIGERGKREGTKKFFKMFPTGMPSLLAHQVQLRVIFVALLGKPTCNLASNEARTPSQALNKCQGSLHYKHP